MNHCRRLISMLIMSTLPLIVDLLQFAPWPDRPTDNTTGFRFRDPLQCGQWWANYVAELFRKCSSAFNSIASRLVSKLKDLGLNQLLLNTSKTEERNWWWTCWSITIWVWSCIRKNFLALKQVTAISRVHQQSWPSPPAGHLHHKLQVKDG